MHEIKEDLPDTLCLVEQMDEIDLDEASNGAYRYAEIDSPMRIATVSTRSYSRNAEEFDKSIGHV